MYSMYYRGDSKDMAGLGKRPTVLVPAAYRGALDKLSKAHLADLVWSLAGRLAESADIDGAIFRVLLDESRIVSTYRGDKPLEVPPIR